MGEAVEDERALEAARAIQATVLMQAVRHSLNQAGKPIGNGESAQGL